MKKIIMVIALVASMLGIGTAALATGDGDPICTTQVVDKEAWTEVVEEAHWQRYSWTGGPHDENTAPAFPSADWQPNVKGDPHGVGVEGAYWRSHGNKGKGDWFYLEMVPAVTIDHPTTYKTIEVPCEEEPPTEEPPTVTPPKVDPPKVDEPEVDKPEVKTPEKKVPTVAPDAGLPNTGA